MRPTQLFLALAAGSLLALGGVLISGCSDGSNTNDMAPAPDFSSGAPDMATSDDLSPSADMAHTRTFEDYVIDLVDNQTAESSTPDDVLTNSLGLPDTELQSDFAKYFP